MEAGGTQTADREGFEQLFDDNARAVLGYAIRRVGPDEAADVLSEVMLVAWRRRDDLPVESEARFWLLGVARNVISNRDRSNVRRERLGERLRAELASATADIADDVGTRIAVRDGLLALPEADREILMLTAWEGLEPSEAATVLGIHAAAARTRLHRARTRLRAALADTSPPPADGLASEERSG